MKTKVLNLDNKSAGDVELNDAIFGLEPRADLIQQFFRVQLWGFLRHEGAAKPERPAARPGPLFGIGADSRRGGQGR